MSAGSSIQMRAHARQNLACQAHVFVGRLLVEYELLRFGDKLSIVRGFPAQGRNERAFDRRLRSDSAEFREQTAADA